MKALFVASCFLIVSMFFVGGFTGAQSARGPQFVRYDKPFKTATMNLATGSVTRGPTPSSESDFDNLDLAGFVGVDTGGGFCRWIDAGVKGQTPIQTDLVTNLVFVYCSSALDTQFGGPGGSTVLGFYEGYVVGGGAPTTTVAVFTLTGLPANTAYTSPFPAHGKYAVNAPPAPVAGTECYVLDLVFPTLLPWADGPIGYSWKFADVDANGLAAATVPFLSCVASCSGPGTGPDGRGMVDLLDQYCPPGFLRSTFSFGTTLFGSYFTSISLDIRELEECTASVTYYNSTSPACVDVLSSQPLIIGTTYRAEVTHASGAATASVLWIRGAKIPGNGSGAGLTCGGAPRGRLLVPNGPFIANLNGKPDSIAPILATQKNFIEFVPLQFGLACQKWYAQAFTIGTGCQFLSNGAEINTGT